MKMYKFAHLSDCHIGVWRDEKLRELNLQAFEKAIDTCIKEKVDFILICGDLFDANIPDLYQVKRAVEKLRLAKQNGINIYLIYGSHDYSPNTISMIDVLESAGLFKKVSQGEFVGDELQLEFTEDQKTWAKITGLPGRKIGLEREYFQALDLESLEQAKGFKIFLFHSPITELKTRFVPETQGVPISLFPRRFNYYAGGNIHKMVREEFADHAVVAYSGPLFGTDFRDLEDMAKGEKRGFFIVEFDKAIKNARFVEIKACDVVYQELDGTKKTAKQVEDELLKLANSVDAEEKIVLLRVFGTLSSGRPVDIDFGKARLILTERGAAYANINRYALSTEEKIELKVKGESKREIEERILVEKMSGFKVDPSIKDEKVRRFLEERLSSEKGTELAKNLLNALKTEQKEGETKTDFHSRVLRSILEVTRLEGSE